MSAFYLLGVFAVWVLLTGLIWKLWRYSRKSAGTERRWIDVTFAVVALTWLALSFWYGGGRKYYYDAEVDRLCAIDGGVKVYETVMLPADRFNQWGQPNFYKPTEKKRALGPEYEMNTIVEYMQKGNPSLRRYHVQVFIKSSGNLLGESISYDRGGGDLPGPWQPSGFSCPSIAGEIPLLTRIFHEMETK